MKNQIFLVIGFFLLVHTQYFLSPALGIFEIYFFLLFIALFIILNIMFVYHSIKSFKERFLYKQRNILLACLVIVISITFYKPTGLIDSEVLHGKNLLTAQTEGAANCLTELELKQDGIFIEHTFCFGTQRVSGKYTVRLDTIWFNDSPEYYKFGVLGSKFGKNVIQLFESNDEEYPDHLFITENEL